MTELKYKQGTFMQYTLQDADILIDLAQQQLILPKLKKTYSVSTGLNGIGEQENSGKTPRGWHCVAQKIGYDLPKNSVLIARKPTGEIYTADYAKLHPERDWILSRILWLQGLEESFNAGAGYDTFQRYIYIHGTPDSEPMGIAASHGCIRMRNDDVIELFNLIPEQALVYISEYPLE